MKNKIKKKKQKKTIKQYRPERFIREEGRDFEPAESPWEGLMHSHPRSPEPHSRSRGPSETRLRQWRTTVTVDAQLQPCIPIYILYVRIYTVGSVVCDIQQKCANKQADARGSGAKEKRREGESSRISCFAKAPRYG